MSTAGNAYCWGTNASGQLGDGSTTSRLVPTLVMAPSGVTFVSVTAGSGHSCALTPANAAYCWGINSSGQLGDGTTSQRLVAVAAVLP